MKTKSSLVTMMLLLAVEVIAAKDAGASQSSAVMLSAAGGDGKISLSWTASGDIRSIQVMRDTDANPKGRQRLASLSGKSRSYTDDSVMKGRQYWYWIKYTDAKRKVWNSDSDSATPAANSTISPVTVGFDKNLAKQSDIVLNTTLNGNILSAIRDGSKTLVAGTDYSLSGNNVTLLKNYLARQAAGTLRLSFDFSAGIDPVLSLAINDSTPASINYTLKVAVNGNGSTSVSSGDHSYAAGTSVTITATPETGFVFSGWNGAVIGDGNSVTITMNANKSLTANFTADHALAFKHLGLMHSQADFDRMRTQVESGTSPWKEGWERLIKNSHSALSWKPNPLTAVYRGSDGKHTENYGVLYNDIAAAYALALRWKVSGDEAYADRAVAILDAWSEKLTELGGNSDRFLSAGLYGYQFANAAEIMRDYKKWPAANLKRFQDMMLRVFYPMNHDFLVFHNDASADHYWANWDLANMASMIAIGVLTDRRDIYDEAVDYFKQGAGNGAIEHVIWKIYQEEGLGQTQESGRDQGHNTLLASLLGAFCQMAWNQDDDLFGYDNNRVLSGMEYIAKYNLGENVPYTPYSNSSFNTPAISEAGRGSIRPGWELLYNHYVIKKGLKAPYVQKFAEKVRPEGGGGDYGPNSGGYDQLGYGTLTATLPH